MLMRPKDIFNILILIRFTLLYKFAKDGRKQIFKLKKNILTKFNKKAP